jgi:AraC-like DNA-binding protein
MGGITDMREDRLKGQPIYSARKRWPRLVGRGVSHYHDHLEVRVSTGAAGRLWIGGRSHELRDDSAYLIAPQVVHSLELSARDGARMHVVQVNTDILARAGLADTDYRDLRDVLPNAGRSIARSIESLSLCTSRGIPIRRARSTSGTHSRLTDMRTLFSILARFSVAAGAGAPVPPGTDLRTARMLDAVAKHAFESYTIETIAREVAMSRAHFARQFKASVGVTVVAHIHALRVERACSLMADKGYSVSQAALETGFCDCTHFVKVFRRLTGTTPKRWAMGEVTG